nr:MAG TPA: hypothetical protein [Caudoviricetes sp.]
MALQTLMESFQEERNLSNQINLHIDALEAMSLRDAFLEAAEEDEFIPDDEDNDMDPSVETLIDDVPETDEDDMEVSDDDMAEEMCRLEQYIPETVIR